MHYNRIHLSKWIDVAKSNDSKACIICHYWLFNHELKFQDSGCNSCNHLTKFCLNLTDNITVKNGDYYCIIHNISKSDAIHLLQKIICLMIVGIDKMYINEINAKNKVYNYYLHNLIKAKKIRN